MSKVMKGQALRRAAKTGDLHRAQSEVPLITDTTELVTQEMAERLLNNNKANRPINWRKVEQYRKQMETGEWKFHGQGIILDDRGNILTGQKRLWAIILSGVPQWMRISRGSPADTANYIDRGTSQSSRDLASRKTDRKHSPTEASIVRAIFALEGKVKPTLDEIGEGLVAHDQALKEIMQQTRGIRKTRERMMILGAIAVQGNLRLLGEVEPLGELLLEALKPIEVKGCWNRGAAFTLAMEKAQCIVQKF